MVSHEAIGPNLDIKFLGIPFQQFQIGLPVFVIKEDGSAVVAEDTQGL